MGVGRHKVQLERVNHSPSPTHSARDSEWAKAEVVLHAASGCPKGTHLILVVHSLILFSGVAGLNSGSWVKSKHGVELANHSAIRLKSHLAFNSVLTVMLNSITFDENRYVTECIRYPAERLLVRPIFREREVVKLRLLNGWPVGVGPLEVQLERVNPSPSPTHSSQECEWAKAEVVLHAARRCSRGTHLILGKFLEREFTPTIV
ncbi:hypothetical protein H5410_036413 [Solanum commersonii]|uniref:Uncharacterized protein n=1 Tax=Solanum commersonii TaxID=4109 RepID=A0A9J5Y4Q8_SOLCO|nr:hypothetical protein H5410_036413 [Solanum commersonii]